MRKRECMCVRESERETKIKIERKCERETRIEREVFEEKGSE